MNKSDIEIIAGRLRLAPNKSDFILGAICALEAIARTNHIDSARDPAAELFEAYDEILRGAE